jgi:energy-coupling factor transporter ATP-binding protein EcfA2
MTLHEGSGLIITGPNASGKSTFLRVVRTYLLPPHITGSAFFPPLFSFCFATLYLAREALISFWSEEKNYSSSFVLFCQKQKNDSSTVVGY